MRKERPLILVSNDDGFTAKGINELIKYLKPLGEIVVMAPDSARSGNSCAITVTQPVSYRLERQEPGVTIYSCSGSPVDCVKLARSTVIDRDPDLVVAGINHGNNSGINVHYSGTMGAVFEGCLNGIPSIGYSLCDHNPDADFSATERYVRGIAEKVLEKGLPPLICLNVNFPVTNNIKGIRISEQANGRWHREWDPCDERPGENFFWLSGEFKNGDPENTKTDGWMLEHGFGAITPTKLDATAYEFMEELKEWFREGE